MLKRDMWIASTTVHRLLTALVMTAQVLSVAHTNLAALAASTAHVKEPRWRACCRHRGGAGARACCLYSLTAQVDPTAHVRMAALAKAALACMTALVALTAHVRDAALAGVDVWAWCHDAWLHRLRMLH